MKSKEVGYISSKREKKAVNMIADLIDKIPLLDSAFTTKDKNILYDGYINLYSNASICNDNYLGKVAVQIKAMSERECREENGYVKISISKVYLKAYFRDGGVLFFKVLLDDNLECKKIFYAALTKIELNRLLHDTEKKYMSVSFKLLPASIAEVRNLVFSHYDNILKQASFNPESFVGMDELEGRVISVNLSCEKDNLISSLRKLKKGDAYLYCRIERGIEIPVNSTPGTYSLDPMTVDFGLFVDDECFYDKCSIIKQCDSLMLVYGNCISLTLQNPSSNGGDACVALNYCLPDYLDDMVHALRFLIKVISGVSIEIHTGEDVVRLFIANVDDKQSNELKQLYEDCSQLYEILSLSGFDKKIDIGKLQKKEILDLLHLYSQFTSGEDVSINNVSAYVVCNCFLLGEYRIVVAAVKEKDGKYALRFDFYSLIDNPAASATKSVPMFFFLSQYVDFWMADNVDYEKIFSVISVLDLDSYLTQIVIVSLNLMLVYDKCHERKVIDLSLRIIRFLFDHTSEKNKNYLLINEFQCIKRFRGLKKKEKKELEMIAEQTLSVEEKTACYALLGEKELVLKYWKEIEDKENFVRYPIAYFIKGFLE